MLTVVSWNLIYIKSLFLFLKMFEFYFSHLTCFWEICAMSIKEVKHNWILKNRNSPLFKKIKVILLSLPFLLCIATGRLVMSVAVVTEARCPGTVRPAFLAPGLGETVWQVLVSELEGGSCASPLGQSI